ncbi:glycerate kinase [Paracoccus sp. Z330]|uniref:Glycerate kinase n=1 Tax=Paracoccus onchidii TaxID=3017813 RepID=A0ABT4ZGA5_9RHOB|nr:glycerate kinase [Paracoccus onchidii]MDB6178341.1 glycerate kinase [Paracoccus onchidii]
MDRPPINDPESYLRGLFDLAVETADPMRVVPAHLPPRPKGRLIVIGAGKASARMAEAVEAHYGECEGLVITRYGYGRPCRGIRIVEAAHPVPDQAGVDATNDMLELLRGLAPDDLVLALISGGGSALLCAPAFGLDLDQKRAINDALLASGAPISQMNLLRKHLSRVKGGQLAATAHPATMLSLLMSDVPGDDPAMIASGPTVGDDSTPEAALAIAEQWKIPLPDVARRALTQGHSGVVASGSARLEAASTVIVAAPSQSLAAARDAARRDGIEVRLLGDQVEGEARDVAADQAAQAQEIATNMGATDTPVLLLSGGELTVTRNGSGVGGPNAEFVLSAAINLQGHPRIFVLACDTDGVDGAAEIAGAVAGPCTLAQAQAKGVSPQAALADNDAHRFFGQINGQVVTGPTLTNVNDFRAFLILPPERQDQDES